MPRPKPVTGRGSAVPLRKFPSTPNTSSSDANGTLTAAAWPANLFVHLFSGTHFIAGSNGPTRAMATGGLRFWKDGRDANDVLLGLFDYREGFNPSLRVNFVDGGEESEARVFTGSEGTMEIGGNTLTISRTPREKELGYTAGTFTEAIQKKQSKPTARSIRSRNRRARLRYLTKST